MLDSLRIKNFRCFEDLEIESLGRVNLIVGKNNVGKSTFLEALRLFSEINKGEVISKLLKSREETSLPLELSSIFFRDKSGATKAQETIIGNIKETHYLRLYLLQKTTEEIQTFTQNDIHAFGIQGSHPDHIKKSQKYNHVIPKPISKAMHTGFPYGFVKSSIHDNNEMAEVWDEIRIKRKNDLAVEILKVLLPEVEDVFFTAKQITMLAVKGNDVARPVKSMGEGMSRLLQIFLYAFQAKDGYLMIDEFENGLHYSIQEEVWEKLFQLAEELNIQVFATTHSMDTIKSFSKVTLKSPEEGRLISLGRNTREIENGKITALTYNEDEIKLIAETGMEVR